MGKNREADSLRAAVTRSRGREQSSTNERTSVKKRVVWSQGASRSVRPRLRFWIRAFSRWSNSHFIVVPDRCIPLSRASRSGASTFVAYRPNDPLLAREVSPDKFVLSGELSSLIKICRPTPGVVAHLPAGDGPLLAHGRRSAARPDV